MITKQLSIFLENKTGRIYDLTRVLSTNGINMEAFSLAENGDFGIMRLVVSDVEKAVKVLKENSFAVSTTDVLCLECPNVPGALSEILDRVAEKGIFIEYMYAFSKGETANIVIRPTDISGCTDILF